MGLKKSFKFKYFLLKRSKKWEEKKIKIWGKFSYFFLFLNLIHSNQITFGGKKILKISRIINIFLSSKLIKLLYYSSCGFSKRWLLEFWAHPKRLIRPPRGSFGICWNFFLALYFTGKIIILPFSVRGGGGHPVIEISETLALFSIPKN